jgi:hypothetical protein
MSTVSDWDSSGHIAYVCPGTNAACDNGTCVFCKYELTACTRCYGLSEGGSMTTDCCGEPLTADQSNNVEDGKLDYRDGVWINEPSPYARKQGI